MGSTVFVPEKEFPYASASENVKSGANILEISTRSKIPFGKSLSTFNLSILLKSGKRVKVECAYQGSKVLEDGTQFENFYWGSPRDAAFDRRIKGKRPVVFRFFGKEYPTDPVHAFFDFLYIVSLLQRKDDVFEKLNEYDGFSDLYYSYDLRKEPNTPARAAAKYVSLIREGLLSKETPSKELLSLLVG